MSQYNVKNHNVKPTLGDYAKATVLLTGCAVTVVIGFTLIAVFGGARKLNPFRKRRTRNN